ncbi:hypothetical protein D3C81_1004110 [compost metagenome]
MQDPLRVHRSTTPKKTNSMVLLLTGLPLRSVILWKIGNSNMVLIQHVMIVLIFGMSAAITKLIFRFPPEMINLRNTSPVNILPVEEQPPAINTTGSLFV